MTRKESVFCKLRKALQFFGAVFLGLGVGGLLRPPITLVSTRALVVIVDSVPVKRSSFAAVTLASGEVRGCEMRGTNCICDSPHGPISVNSRVVDCDIVRWKYYNHSDGGAP